MTSGVHNNHVAVKKYKPGQSGNPGGRTKEKLFREAMMLALNEAMSDTDPRKKLRVISENLVNAATQTEDQSIMLAATALIADRMDGKAHVSANITTNFPLFEQAVPAPTGVVLEHDNGFGGTDMEGEAAH